MNLEYNIRLVDLLPSSLLISVDNMSTVTKSCLNIMSRDSNKYIDYFKFYGLLMIDLHPEKIRFVKDFYDPDIEDDSINLTIDRF